MATEELIEKKNKPTIKMGLFKRLVFIITKPSLFFAVIKDEIGYGKPIYYLIIIVFIAFFGQLVSKSGELFQSSPSFVLPFILTFYFSVIIIEIGIAIVFSFLQAGIFHLVGKIFKITGSFNNTYKAVTYSLTPYILIQSLGALSFYSYLNPFKISFDVIDLNIFFIWTMLLTTVGIAKLQEVSFKKALYTVLIPAIILLIFSFPFLLSQVVNY